ncbi:hypothetical protein YC2023_119593 [Brassica napus]
MNFYPGQNNKTLLPHPLSCPTHSPPSSAAGLTVNSILQVYAAESDVRSMEKLLAGCEVITMLHVRTALDMVPREKQESIGSERSRVV